MYWRTFKLVKIQTIKVVQVFFNFLFKAQMLRMAVVLFSLMSSKGPCFQAVCSVGKRKSTQAEQASFCGDVIYNIHAR